MNRLRILLVGNIGQVGWELLRTLATLGDVVSYDRPDIELTSPDSIRSLIRKHTPHVIVNAAAYTAVDKAEDEPDIAHAINAQAPAVMAEEAKRLGGVFVTYSTDYVFDGTKVAAYTEDDRPNPLSVYGKTKLAGDEAVQNIGGAYAIFRTSWVYGARGKNFLLTMLKLAAERLELKVVDDQVGAPTWSRSIAETTAQALVQGLRGAPTSDAASVFQEFSGVYNLTSSGKTTWCGFTSAITEQMKIRGVNPVARVLPITTAEYPVRATRPKNSVLNNDKLERVFGLRLPPWDVALGLVVDELSSIPSALPRSAAQGK